LNIEIAVWRDIAVPAAEGLLTHARQGDPTVTVARLGEALPGIIAIGGSHAQRDLFEQIWLDALLRDASWILLLRAPVGRRTRSTEASFHLVNQGNDRLR
jgi:hypothetical protein